MPPTLGRLHAILGYVCTYVHVPHWWYIRTVRSTRCTYAAPAGSLVHTVSTHTTTHLHTYTHTHKHTHTCIHTHIHSLLHTYVHPYAITPTHLHSTHTYTHTHTITSTLSHTLVHILRPPDLSKDPDPFPDVTGDIIFVWKHLCQHDKAYVLPCGTFQEFYEALQMSSSMANSTLLARGGQSTMTHTLLFPCVLEFSGPAGGVGCGQLPYTFLMVCPAGIHTGVWD